jgi:hypothetical protein
MSRKPKAPAEEFCEALDVARLENWVDSYLRGRPLLSLVKIEADVLIALARRANLSLSLLKPDLELELMSTGGKVEAPVVFFHAFLAMYRRLKPPVRRRKRADQNAMNKFEDDFAAKLADDLFKLRMDEYERAPNRSTLPTITQCRKEAAETMTNMRIIEPFIGQEGRIRLSDKTHNPVTRKAGTIFRALENTGRRKKEPKI